MMRKKKQSKKEKLYNLIVLQIISQEQDAGKFIYELRERFVLDALLTKIGSLSMVFFPQTEFIEKILSFPAKIRKEVFRELSETFPYKPKNE